MTHGTLIAASGPVDPPDWWEPLASDLALTGLRVVTPEDECDAPPFSVGWLASVAQQVQTSGVSGPLVVVGHGTAGPLLPALARTQRAAGRDISGYVFVDATLPRPGPTGHLDLLQAASRDEAEAAHDHLHTPGSTWPQPSGGVDARPRDHEFWTETLPAAIDWPDAPCSYVYTGEPAAGCGDTAFWKRSADARGWQVIDDSDVAGGVRRALELMPH